MDYTLFEAEESLKIISENIDVGLWRWDASGKLTFVNQAVCEIFDCQREDLLEFDSSKWADLFHGEWDDYVRTHWDYAMHGGSGEFEALIVAPSGTKFVHVNYYPIRNGKYLGTVGIVRDVTEEHVMLNHLKKLKEDLDHVPAMAS